MPAHRANPESQANPANQECPVRPVLPVNHRGISVRSSHHRPATRARQDHLDQRVHLENPVPPASKDRPATPAKTAATDHKAHLVHPDQAVNRVTTVRRDHPVTRPAQFRPLPENPDRTERQDHPAQRVHPDHLDLTANREQLVARDHPDLPVHPETMVLQETRVRLVRTARRENRVCAPNIAPPTAVFSSRMEQGDKRARPTDPSYLRRGYYIDDKLVSSLSTSILFLVLVSTTTTIGR